MENPNKLKSKGLCIHPWSHLAINPNGDVIPCCHQRGSNPTILGNVKKDSVDDIFNGEKMKKLRKDMLNGILPEDTCHKCIHYEKLGVKSPRQWAFHNNYADKVVESISRTEPDGTFKDYKIKYWDLRFSNICNMTCVMCSPEFSSRWTQEAKKLANSMKSEEAVESLGHALVLDRSVLDNEKVINVNDQIKWVDKGIHDVEKIYFAGGEPLIMDAHWYILEKLDELKKYDVDIKYNTNLLKIDYKGKSAIDYWKKWSKRDLLIENSLDESGARAEWIRYGTDWKVVSGNIRKLIDANIRCQPIVSIGCYNIFRLPEILDEFEELYKGNNERFAPRLNPVFSNAWCIQVLPDDFKRKIKKKIKRYEKSKRIHNPQLLKTFYAELDKPHNPTALRNFLRKSAILDCSRSKKLFEAIPELEFLNDIGNNEYYKTKKLFWENSNLKEEKC
jgi:radical SAM protein with 4Fe4S-binding SPASM domain